MEFAKSWKFWTISSGILCFIALLAYGFTTDPKNVPSPWIGKAAPEFTVTHLDGQQKLSLSDLRGKPVVLNFWGSWCPSCRDEAHVLEAFYQNYSVQQDQVHVIGIAFQDTIEKAQAFAQRFRKTYFLALDSPSGDITLDYGIYGAPETFFIDKAGIIQHKHVGAVTPQILEEQFSKL